MLALIRDGRHDPPVTLRDVAGPEPARDEAAVQVVASSLNRGELDLLAVRSDGWRPGQDIAGIVIQAAANGEGPRAGARVAGLVEAGGWSERVAVPVTRLAELDPAVSFEEAATLGLAGRTALRVVRLAGPLLGRSVLVLGAGGGVGHLVVQLASLAGATVTAEVRDPARGGQLTDAGPERIVSANELEAGAYDVVLDGVGGTSIERAVRAIRPDGSIVLFGATDRQPANLTLLDFIGHEGARILTYFSYASGDETSVGRDLATLADMVARRRLRPTIGAVIDWHQADEALAALRSNQIAGKAVLSIDGSDMRCKGVALMNMFVTGGSGVLGRAVGDAAMSLGGGDRLTW
jgi:NADPH:quinone reductase-like Zn-dependent oxidoreductase